MELRKGVATWLLDITDIKVALHQLASNQWMDVEDTVYQAICTWMSFTMDDKINLECAHQCMLDTAIEIVSPDETDIENLDYAIQSSVYDDCEKLADDFIACAILLEPMMRQNMLFLTGDDHVELLEILFSGNLLHVSVNVI